MPSVDVLDLNKRKVSTVDLPAALFGQTPNGPLLHEAVVMQRAGERQGTSSTLRRGEVRGSGKKPWKQKHTGRARAGSVRSPVWRHGGSVFGPKPRSYEQAFPKRKYHRALQVALSGKLTAGELLVVADFGSGALKTRELQKSLGQLGVNSSVLLVVSNTAEAVHKAARNLPQVKVVSPEQLNVYDLLKHQVLVIAEPMLGRLQEVWA